MTTGCTAGEDRTIRAVADRFTYLWTQQDALHISELFTPNGDIRHPDGSIERGQDVILANRVQLFSQKAYANSRYRVQLNDVRCLRDTGVAIADGKWELRLETTLQSRPGQVVPATPVNSGWCTLTLLKSAGNSWAIEAWRYTMNPPPGADQPVLLAKPGVAGRGGG